MNTPVQSVLGCHDYIQCQHVQLCNVTLASYIQCCQPFFADIDLPRVPAYHIAEMCSKRPCHGSYYSMSACTSVPMELLDLTCKE